MLREVLIVQNKCQCMLGHTVTMQTTVVVDTTTTAVCEPYIQTQCMLLVEHTTNTSAAVDSDMWCVHCLSFCLPNRRETDLCIYLGELQDAASTMDLL